MYRLKQLTLLGGDWLALYLGLLLAVTARHYQLPATNIINDLIAPMSELFVVAAPILFITGLYDIVRLKNHWPLYQKVAIAAASWLVLGVIFFYINPHPRIAPKTILLLNAMFGFALIALWRYVYIKILAVTIWKTSVVFIGLTPASLELINLIHSQPERGYTIIGVVSNGSIWGLPAELVSLTVPTLDRLPNSRTDLIIMGENLPTDSALAKELYQRLFQRTQVLELEKFYEEITKRVPPFTFSANWFLNNLQEQNKKIYDRVRLLLDYAAASLMGLFFIVTLPLIALAIKLNSRGPIFFKQIRVGQGGRLFTVYKYRTMRVLSSDGSAELHGPQFASQRDERVTTVGRVLRRTRCDEIPQFINIWRSEMNIIGPRPERPEFVAQLTGRVPFYSLRHLIKPGLTGWAQLHQHYGGTLDENLQKLEYDLYYIKNRGPLLDLAIVLRTFNLIASMKGR